MEEDIKDTMIQYEKEKEMKFSLSFKVILGISIFLTGFFSLIGLLGNYTIIRDRVWTYMDIKSFSIIMLFYNSVLICFISLISIAITKKPFSRILVWCIMAIGILFVAVSLIIPHIPGYGTSGLKIFYFGKYTFFDTIDFIIGFLIILFSRIIHYGFIYQKDADMTV